MVTGRTGVLTPSCHIYSENYLGTLAPIGNKLALIERFNKGEAIPYRLDFPVSSPRPQITSITVNNEIACMSPTDQGGRYQYITSVSLEQTLSLNNGPSFGGNPLGVFGENQNFPNFMFDNVNTHSWTSSSGGNTDPFFIINDSQIDMDDRMRPTNPFDLNTIFFQTPKPVQKTTWLRPVQTTQPTVMTTQATRRPPTPVDNSQCGININIDTVPLIYNGISYNRGEWPWVVAIFKRQDIGLNYICSGTLISDRHVVTAAHCIHRKTMLTSINDIVVKVGVHNILDWGDDDVTVTRVISSAKIHESFNSSTLANDILLLTFTRSVEFNSYIKAVCLWSGNTDLELILDHAGVVTGWGVSEIGPAGKGVPRMVRMPIVSTNACRASKPEFHKLTSSMTLCAGDRNGAGPCLGDSGGGLYMRHNSRWTLRGIVSVSLLPPNGDMTCNLNEFIVFTDAAKYVTWITDNMKT